MTSMLRTPFNAQDRKVRIVKICMLPGNYMTTLSTDGTNQGTIKNKC